MNRSPVRSCVLAPVAPALTTDATISNICSMKRSARAAATASEQEEFVSVAEAARRLRVSPSTVWRWIEADKLTAYRVGPKTIRIRRDDLEALIQPARATSKR